MIFIIKIGLLTHYAQKNYKIQCKGTQISRCSWELFDLWEYQRTLANPKFLKFFCLSEPRIKPYCKIKIVVLLHSKDTYTYLLKKSTTFFCIELSWRHVRSNSNSAWQVDSKTFLHFQLYLKLDKIFIYDNKGTRSKINETKIFYSNWFNVYQTIALGWKKTHLDHSEY